MDQRSRRRVRRLPVIAGIALFAAGIALAELSVFTLVNYHLVGFAMSLAGSFIAAYGIFGRSLPRRTSDEQRTVQPSK